MTIEDRVKQVIGDLVIQLAQAQLERDAALARVKELEAQK